MTPAAADEAFALAGPPRFQLMHIGEEQAPVLVADGVMAEPERLVAFAARPIGFRPMAEAGNFYPGVRAPAPQAYVQALFAALGGPIAETFGITGPPRRLTCAYSLTTQPPETLSPLQRTPHFDSTDARYIAVLHYLFQPPHGGTSFYRHRATGYEAITPERAPRYLSELRREFAEEPPAAAYANGSDERFERIGGVDPAFDRVLVYRGRMLHSGDIDPGRDLDPSPLSGRLTLNTFISYGGAG